ncbi:hypothetical protein HMPREF9104_00914 [Lentilactobacillus kisonensis F0435]|uniref:Uncharacterized protein n=1 Tax=Lentilactobacillus kisonensis F0435 TaxID=797516 RepID=H1LE88_9LACO|nr:hypothetical protein HMPREF9104_00914 [Lentilactobacillus kisonensis F0435]
MYLVSKYKYIIYTLTAIIQNSNDLDQISQKNMMKSKKDTRD